MPTHAAPRPPLTRAYTLKSSKIPDYFRVVFENPIPEVFDTAFLAKSGFRYAIDRSFIDILKSLGFLTETGHPTRRYRDFRDRRQAGAMLRLGLAEAYAGLLAERPDAAVSPEQQVMETVSRYFAGEINDMAASGIAATFLALTCYAADLDNGSAPRPAVATLPVFEPAASEPVAQAEAASPHAAPVSAPAAPVSAVAEIPAPAKARETAREATPAPSPEAANAATPVADTKTADTTDDATDIVIETLSPEARDQNQGTPQRPVIHITLPVSTDEAVYDAIFASLKRHLASPGGKA